jgi:hypothetical protein
VSATTKAAEAITSRWTERFNRSFVATLRRRLMDPQLDIVWDDGEIRRGKPHPVHDAGTADFYASRPFGCWRVVRYSRVVTSEDGDFLAWPSIYGIPIFFKKTVCVPLPAYVLDGGWGWPWTPGTWLIEMMAEMDEVRHPDAQRKEDEHYALAERMKQHDEDRLIANTRDRTGFKDWIAHTQRNAASPTKEEEKTLFSRAEEFWKRREERRNQEQREAKLFHGKSLL